MNSIFTEENLLAFTTAARFGSFSKAAAELGVTTSAISYTIKRMETGLDVVLFVRNTRSIELTESGFYFYRKALHRMCCFVKGAAKWPDLQLIICPNSLRIGIRLHGQTFKIRFDRQPIKMQWLLCSPSLHLDQPAIAQCPRVAAVVVMIVG